MGDNGSLGSHDHDGTVLIKENENLNVDIVEDLLDSDLEERNNPLTVSRFVCDSFTRGMLNGGKMAQKENNTLPSRLIFDKACNDEYEENVESCGMKSLLLDDKTKEIADLRRELELISKLLTGCENEEIESLDRRNSGRFVSGRERNGEHTGSLALTHEKLEYLRKLSHEQLIKYFKNEMNEMKREHDYIIQEMTEEYFSVKRRYLNLEERGLLISLKKEEFDVVRKKIMDIISRLDKSVYEGKNDAYYRTQCDLLFEENRQLRESLREAERKIDVGDSCVEFYMAEECCTIIYKNVLKDASKKLGELSINVSERERSEVVDKERLKEKINCLECLVKEKENLVQIVENDLATVKEKLETVSQHNYNLQFQTDQQAMVIQDINNELRAASARALEKTKGYEMEISKLRRKLESASKNMKIAENEKVKCELKLSSMEAEQKKVKNQFVSTVLSLDKWSQCFYTLECSLADKMKKTNSRLESMQSQLRDLLDEVDELKARESNYKQLMEKKTCDLQKAETEVDLLGDEIESLLNLLQKIHIALDHYSPILKHYPGIIEILKLVRRELWKNQRVYQSLEQVSHD